MSLAFTKTNVRCLAVSEVAMPLLELFSAGLKSGLGLANSHQKSLLALSAFWSLSGFTVFKSH